MLDACAGECIPHCSITMRTTGSISLLLDVPVQTELSQVLPLPIVTHWHPRFCCKTQHHRQRQPVRWTARGSGRKIRKLAVVEDHDRLSRTLTNERLRFAKCAVDGFSANQGREFESPISFPGKILPVFGNHRAIYGKNCCKRIFH